MELRIFRTWNWVLDNKGRLGGPLHYKLVHQDKLQYRPVTGFGEWLDVPVVEGEKPKHPDEVNRARNMNEINELINNAVVEGKIKLQQSQK